MTIAARGRIPLPAGGRQAMHAGPVTFGLFFMTSRAFRGFGGDIVVRMFEGNIAVATGAGIGAMHRSGQFGFIHKQPDGFAGGVGLVESLVGVAVEAGAVLNVSAESAEDGGCERAQGNAQASKTVTHASKRWAGIINFALPDLPIYSLFLRNSGRQKRAKRSICELQMLTWVSAEDSGWDSIPRTGKVLPVVNVTRA